MYALHDGISLACRRDFVRFNTGLCAYRKHIYVYVLKSKEVSFPRCYLYLPILLSLLSFSPMHALLSRPYIAVNSAAESGRSV